MFLHRGGSIHCRVTGCRHYSADLTQGGLEIPFLSIFTAKRADVNKAEKLLSLPLALADQSGMPPLKKPKLQDSSSSLSEPDKVWLRLGGSVLKLTEKNIITSGEKLTDLHVDFAQKLMKKQFRLLKGLRSTLLQSREEPKQDCSCMIQVIHCRCNHWIVASSIGCDRGIAKVYDSAYSNIDSATEDVVKSIFGHGKGINLANTQRQVNGNDCGVYAIAVTTTLALHRDTSKLKYQQAAMRIHLVMSFEGGQFTPFPIL